MKKRKPRWERWQLNIRWAYYDYCVEDIMKAKYMSEEDWDTVKDFITSDDGEMRQLAYSMLQAFYEKWKSSLTIDNQGLINT